MEEQNKNIQDKQLKPYKIIFTSVFVLGFLYSLILPIVLVVFDTSSDRYHCPSAMTNLLDFLYTKPISLILFILFAIAVVAIFILKHFTRYKNHPGIVILSNGINIWTLLLFTILAFIVTFFSTPIEFLPAGDWEMPC